MENFYSQISTIKNAISELNLCNSLAIYIKEERINRKTVIIAVTDNGFGMKKEDVKIGRKSYLILSLPHSACMSLLLQKDALIPALFKDTVCLKDDACLTNIMLLAIKPIEKMQGKIKSASLSAIWNSRMKSEQARENSRTSLSILFRGISSDTDFIYNDFLSLCTQLKDYTHKSRFNIEFSTHKGEKTALLTYHLPEGTFYDALDKIQKHLYTHSPELKLQNIIIPYHPLPSKLEISLGENYSLINDVASEVQTLVMETLGQEGINNNSVVTQFTYFYLLLGKLFFRRIEDFERVNGHVYHLMNQQYMSDTIQYELNNSQGVNPSIKTYREYENLCLSNAGYLSANYLSLISKWNVIDVSADYEHFISAVKALLSVLGKSGKERTDVFVETASKIFNSFDIYNYYKAYIPFIFNYLKNEI